jgi:hypothetical protein
LSGGSWSSAASSSSSLIDCLSEIGMTTRFLRLQPLAGRARPLASLASCLQSISSYSTSARLSALPSAISDVASTIATKIVESPVTPRRNHLDEVQGSIALPIGSSGPRLYRTVAPLLNARMGVVAPQLPRRG